MTDITEKMSEMVMDDGAEGAEVDAEPSPLEKRLIDQLEFYFGDSNLPRDAFMLREVKLDDGWIPMSVMLRFNQLAKLSRDIDVIVAAAKHSQLIEVCKSGNTTKLRRSPEFPIPELNCEEKALFIRRTVYCKGFPVDADLDAVMAVVNAPNQTVKFLMCKYKDVLTQQYLFNGSVFVTFKTEEDAKNFLEKTTFVENGILTKMWQIDFERKRQQFENESRKWATAQRRNQQRAQREVQQQKC